MAKKKIINKILMRGNEAIAESAIRAGCRFFAGYPITPQNELTAYMAIHMERAGGVFIQSESEIAAINMVMGASAAGARCMTSSSSPGISLKQEGISYIAGSQLPVVIVNIMRGGPGLGNIAPSQADYFQSVKGGGHGGYHLIVLAPSNVQELSDLTFLAFELADKYRNPVMILADGMLGQMMEPIKLQVTSQKSKVKNKSKNLKPWALTGCKGRKPNVIKSFYIEDGKLEEFNTKLQKNYALIKKNEVSYSAFHINNSDLILVSYGLTSRICRFAMLKARKEGFKVGLIRPISLWPFPETVFKKASKKAKKFLVVEMSAGQMVEDVKLAVNGKRDVLFYGRTGGGVPTEDAVYKEIIKLLKKK